MNRLLSRAAVLAGLALGPAAVAQQPLVLLPQPRVSSAFPPGLQAGTGAEVTVNGTDLDDVTGLVFSHPGLRAELVPPPKPDPKADPSKMKKGGVPTAVRFKVTAAADVPVGQYDLRAVGKWGVSNPRAFTVGDRPEVEEQEPNDDAEPREPAASLGGGPMTLPVKNVPRAQRVELGTTVNGVISTPTDVDYVVFRGPAGKRVLVTCLATSIDSKARPLVEVFDAANRPVGQNRNYKDNDAVCDVTLPADGDYYVRVSEFAYQQGTADSFYRLTVGAGPWIDGVFPPAVNPGKPTQLTVYGRNLPGSQPVPGATIDGRPVEAVTVTVTPPTDPAARARMAFRGRVAPVIGLQDGFEYRIAGPDGASNPVPIFLTDLPVTPEKDAGNDTPEAAEPLTVPGEVAGRIGRPNDRDFYRFAAKKGDVLVVEAFGDRAGGANDLYLRARDDKNKDLSPELDDDPDVLHPVAFYTRTGDPPAFRFTAPADGSYLVLVGALDANSSYGPRCPYRLRVSPPRPDFRAVVMPKGRETPSTVVARPEGEVAYDVYVNRTDGFTGPVTAVAENLPAGVTCQPATVGTNARWGTLVLSCAAGAAEWSGPITVKCSATVNGQPVTREARPATVTWGVPQGGNGPTLARLDHQLFLAVRPDKSALRLTADLAAATVKTKDKDGKEKDEKAAGPIFVKPGDKLTVPVKLLWQAAEARTAAVNVSAEPFQSSNSQAPVAANNGQPVQIAAGKNDGAVVIDVRPNAPPGTYAVALRADTPVSMARDPDQKDKKTNVSVLAYAQPFEVTVLPTALAKVTVQPPANLKPGGTADLVVKVDRQFDYAGEFQVTIDFGKDAKGLTAKPVTLPAGQDEVKVPVTAAADAKPGGVGNVSVQVVATVHGKFPVAHEQKVNLTVVK